MQLSIEGIDPLIQLRDGIEETDTLIDLMTHLELQFGMARQSG